MWDILKLQGEQQRLLYTRQAAHTCGFAGLGQLTEGYSADFAVLSKDIFSIDPEETDTVKVEATYIEGQRVY